MDKSTLDLISVLRSLPDLRTQPSINHRKNLLGDILTVLTESTPLPKPFPILNQTLFLYTTNTVLKKELRLIYIGIPGFYETYFSGIEGLEEEGYNPLFTGNGWRDWPQSAKEREGYTVTSQRSMANRKLDIVLGELKSNLKEDSVSKTWHTRRFALDFTLYGLNIQLWEFDRVDRLQFVSTIIVSISEGEKYIEIIRDGRSERLILDSLIKRAPSYREGDKVHAPLREKKNVVNVARYYYHKTVYIDKIVDNIRSNSSSIANDIVDTRRIDCSTSNTGCKRSFSYVSAALLPSKRTCSSSTSESGHGPTIQNRVHRRVVIRDYGILIYKTKSRVSMLSALENCIEDDISTGNLIVNEEEENRSWLQQRERPSGTRGKIGTRAFIAIGLLLGERHNFNHDLDKSRKVSQFEKWNYVDTEELAKLKLGTISDVDIFKNTIEANFTEYYGPLMPWVLELREVVFPNRKIRKKEDKGVYLRMRQILRSA
ncbi:hypothetical protein BDV37DRAFT_270398 [Aspergillus pseudonomiae]|uniref:Fungal-type protein kinase domain-containing protein n=1 Tax=Aspergillus pseudonomiae TaxID=1506151 RepID=A0A5N7DHN2_9EURO|nr:uncharacterized protein BDV37DRAFT_270398 [Aspergillus pseudonomiae]KAE8405940.1 hypothetical protein BDV37DRAFT_270398 [Aspergillus pseudonomiae]